MKKTLYYKKETFLLNYTYTGTTYPSFSVYANIVNYLFGKDLCRVYLTDGMNLTSLFNEEKHTYLYNDFLGFEKAYKHFTNWINIKNLNLPSDFRLNIIPKCTAISVIWFCVF